jgi:predicted transcriptional regulator
VSELAFIGGRMAKRLKSRTVLPSPAEFRLLDILWQIDEGTIDDIIGRSVGCPQPNYKTVQTLLRIMERKGLVSHYVRGRAFVFQPRVKRNHVNRISIQSFIDRYFRGSPAQLVVNLLEDQPIDSDELTKLEELIRDRRKALK